MGFLGDRLDAHLEPAFFPQQELFPPLSLPVASGLEPLSWTDCLGRSSSHLVVGLKVGWATEAECGVASLPVVRSAAAPTISGRSTGVMKCSANGSRSCCADCPCSAAGLSIWPGTCAPTRASSAPLSCTCWHSSLTDRWCS